MSINLYIFSLCLMSLLKFKSYILWLIGQIHLSIPTHKLLCTSSIQTSHTLFLPCVFQKYSRKTNIHSIMKNEIIIGYISIYFPLPLTHKYLQIEPPRTSGIHVYSLDFLRQSLSQDNIHSLHLIGISASSHLSLHPSLHSVAEGYFLK